MEPARVRINNHRLMREEEVPMHVERVDEHRKTTDEREARQKRILLERSLLHTVAFLLGFVVAAGVGTLSVLIIVRSPENLAGLVLTGLMASGAFVVTFSFIRVAVLSYASTHFTAPLETEPVTGHWGKSVTYGFLGLVVAILLAGLIINTALAGSTIATS